MILKLNKNMKDRDEQKMSKTSVRILNLPFVLVGDLEEMKNFMMMIRNK